MATTLIVAALLFFVSAEIIVRLKGHRPYLTYAPYLKVEGPGKYLTHDTALGYVPSPGRFTIRSEDSKIYFVVTHSKDGLRITRPPGTAPPEGAEALWFMGDSITYGWRLNDDQTYPWLIQQKLPNYDVENFGVPGYGTLQQLIRFRLELEKRKKPAAVVMLYGPFHDGRNTLARSWLKYIRLEEQLTGDYFMLPYARFDASGKLTFGTKLSKYCGLPLIKYSAFMHYWDKLYNKREYISLRCEDVSKELIRRFAQTCRDRDIRLAVLMYSVKDVNEPQVKEMADFCEGQGVMAIMPITDPNKPENVFALDLHPTALADRKIADGLYRRLVDAGFVSPQR